LGGFVHYKLLSSVIFFCFGQWQPLKMAYEGSFSQFYDAFYNLRCVCDILWHSFTTSWQTQFKTCVHL